MAPFLQRFLAGRGLGQDLIEYSLLITFIAIACAALVGSGRPAVNAIWQRSTAK